MKYIFTNGHILDGTKDMKVLDGHSVLVEDDKITGIVKGNTVPDGFKEINLEGKYLMPGLINMHVHLAGNGKPQKKQRDNEKTVKLLMGTALSRAVTYKVVKDFAKTELMSGVTTIRTVGGLADFDTRVRDDIRNGKADGPRILAANEGISVPGGHMAGSVAVAANNIDEALVQVDIAKSQNVDLIKLMITGGVLDAKAKGVPGELKMKPEMVKAVCDKAHALGYKVAAHVESPEGVRVALENGVDSIEHGAKPDVGCPWITQYDFWRELYYFHKYVGVSNAFALYTATLNSAVMAGIGDDTGSVEAGKCADLIVTKNNPLDDLRALRNVDLVMARGRLYNNPKFKTKNIVTKELDKFCDLC